jgi:hypothetical protein
MRTAPHPRRKWVQTRAIMPASPRRTSRISCAGTARRARTLQMPEPTSNPKSENTCPKIKHVFSDSAGHDTRQTTRKPTPRGAHRHPGRPGLARILELEHEPKNCPLDSPSLQWTPSHRCQLVKLRHCVQLRLSKHFVGVEVLRTALPSPHNNRHI